MSAFTVQKKIELGILVGAFHKSMFFPFPNVLEALQSIQKRQVF